MRSADKVLFAVVMIASQSLVHAQITVPSAGIIATLAGNGTGSHSGDGGLATNASLTVANAVAFDTAGNLYVTDGSSVRKVQAATGIISTIAGGGTSGFGGDGGPATSATLNSDDGIAVDQNGNVYVSDNNRIRKITLSTGTINTIAGNGSQGFSGDGGPATNAQLNLPSGIAVDPQGNVYFSDFANNRVRKISATTGTITTYAGNGTAAFSGDGGPATGAGIYYPRGLALDMSGNLYVSDYGNHRIRLITSSGIITTVAGNGTATYSGDGSAGTNTAIGNPWGIAVDSFHNVYFADFFGNSVRMLNGSTSTITTLAGNGTRGYAGDGGPARNSELYSPKGLALDGHDALFVGDYYNRRVRAVGSGIVDGVVNPKYVIVGVTYAPPGPNSYVQYTATTLVGNTTTLSSSFSANESLSVSVGSSGGVKGWSNGQVTGTTSTAFTQAYSNSSAITVSGQSSQSDKTLGTPNAFSPVTHDYDLVWLWLNPLVVYRANPANPNSLTWKGYGFDMADQPAIDVYPVYVGYLNGHFGPLNAADARVLSRSWATGQTWPSGEGPGLTPSDLASILGSDPFSNSNYTINLNYGANPVTTTDGRFSLSGGANANSQTFAYTQSASGGGAGLTQQYSTIYSNTSTLNNGTTYTTQQAFGIDERFNGNFFVASVTYDLKQSQMFTWTTQTQASLTTTNTQSAMLSITGPPCSGSPCNPAYAGPAEFDVYQDNLYGTFMFNPVH